MSNISVMKPTFQKLRLLNQSLNPIYFQVGVLVSTVNRKKYTLKYQASITSQYA